MNNEPVVPFGWFWFESEENKSPYTQITGYAYERFSTMKPDGSAKIDEGSLIPLYAHPAKEHFEDEPQAEELHEIMQSNAELTDEEIAVIGDKCFGTMSYELWVQTNEFARAILRKAQEK